MFLSFQSQSVSLEYMTMIVSSSLEIMIMFAFSIPDLKIGFDNTSMTIASTELVLDVSRYYGILQSGESSTIKLQVESLSGMDIHK